MSIRFKKYQINNKTEAPLKAIRLTERNLEEVVAYVNRNGGEAKSHDTGIKIRQHNYGEDWGKLDWRVARVGDFVCFLEWIEPADGIHKRQSFKEFFRIKEDHFEASHSLVA